jgi:hypothetical protein
MDLLAACFASKPMHTVLSYYQLPFGFNCYERSPSETFHGVASYLSLLGLVKTNVVFPVSLSKTSIET